MNYHLPAPELLDRLAPFTEVPGTGGLGLHQTERIFDLWEELERSAEGESDVPYWAVAWPAAVVMVRYLQARPELVRDKRVLDIGSGCGLVGIACVRLEAAHVTANDIDTASVEIARMNEERNGVSGITYSTTDLLDTASPPDADIVLVADMFYTRDMGIKLCALLDRYAEKGVPVYIADGGRNYAPTQKVRQLYTEDRPVIREIEGKDIRTVRILRYGEKESYYE